MGVEVYIWAGNELRRVDVQVYEAEGIEICGVFPSRTRALRDRIYAIAQQEGLDLERIKVVVTPSLTGGSTEGIEVATAIGAQFASDVGNKSNLEGESKTQSNDSPPGR